MKEDFTRIVVVGSGNIAAHLCLNLSKTGHSVQCFGRNDDALQAIAKQSGIATESDWGKLAQADVYIVAVRDDAISDVCRELAKYIPFQAIIAHTSGSKPIEEIGGWKHKAVFYPLQTFNRDIQVDWSKIPVFIEGDKLALSQLSILASQMGAKSYIADSAARAKLHVAAVFVCNFPVYLYSVAEGLLKGNNYGFDVLKPLIEQTTDKIINFDSQSELFNLLTGPAKRGDADTIKKHIKELALNKGEQSVYQTLTDAIIEKGEIK